MEQAERQARTFHRIAKGWFFGGLVGLAFVALIAVSHYVFDAPVWVGRPGHLASSGSIVGLLLLLGGGFGLFAAVGGWELFVRKPTDP